MSASGGAFFNNKRDRVEISILEIVMKREINFRLKVREDEQDS